jgi:hypothetical protein
MRGTVSTVLSEHLQVSQYKIIYTGNCQGFGGMAYDKSFFVYCQQYVIRPFT